MTGPLILLATATAIVVTAGLIAASFRLRSVPAYLLAVYVLAYAELVVLVTALSFAHLVVRWALIAGVAALLAAGVATWALAGRPPSPSARAAVRTLRLALRDPPLAVLAALVAVGFAYLTALALFTPPNSIDALWYHLPRAAVWAQMHGVAYIPGVNDTRLNGNPPVAEIGALGTMVLSGTDRFVTLVQLAAYSVLPLAVYGIARRLLVDRRPALCAALAFAALPVALLQASGAKNDLVLASFASACVYFCLGARGVEIALAGAAFALALGTKIFAPLFLPIIALVVLAGTSRRRALRLAAVAVPALVVGSAWNFLNIARTGSFLGDLESEATSSGTVFGLSKPVATTFRYLIDFLEVPGAAGWWFTGYVVAALALGALLLHNRNRWPRQSILAAAALAVLPVFVIAFGPLAQRAYRFALFHLGRPRLGILDSGRSLYDANPMSAYFGPLGVAALLSLFVLIRMRRSVPRVALPLAAAPLLLVLGIAFTVGYSETSGRFFVFPMALAVAACALFLSSRPVVWAVVALSVPTLVLTLHANIEKPPSVWGKPRWQVQTLVGPNNGETTMIRYVAESLPRDGHLGLALHSVDISYPFFDSHLTRRVRFVSSTGSPPRDVDWLALAPGFAAPRGVWRELVRTPSGWRLYGRSG